MHAQHVDNGEVFHKGKNKNQWLSHLQFSVRKNFPKKNAHHLNYDGDMHM